MPTLLLTGASGMIGKELIKHFTGKGFNVRTLVRNPKKADGINSFYWDYLKEEIDISAFDKVDYLINLAGANIAHRWTFKYKKEIYDSRIMSTDFLFKTLKKNNIRLKKIINASGTGFYGNSSTQNLNENSPTGKDFLSMVCRDWENSANQFSTIKIPVCILRIGVVISVKGGFVKKVGLPIKYFAGVHIGTGQQIISWIALQDLCNVFYHCFEKNLVGIFNASSSNPMSMKQADNAIAKFYHRKIWLPNLPEWVLKMFLGEMSSVVFSSCHAANTKLLNTGFVFQYDDFGKALAQ